MPSDYPIPCRGAIVHQGSRFGSILLPRRDRHPTRYLDASLRQEDNRGRVTQTTSRMMCLAMILRIALVLSFLLAAPLFAKVPVLIDTDIGDDIDDALALALAFSSPELE